MEKSRIAVMPNFYDTYINLVPKGVDLIEELKGTKRILEVLQTELLAHQDFAYADGKWTVKDVLQHIIDTERVMAYRALALARGEQQELIGYDQDKYAYNTTANQRTVDGLLQEFALVRETTIVLFASFTDEMLLKNGVCGGVFNVSPLVFGFVCIGHAQHHVNVLLNRYFTNK